MIAQNLRTKEAVLVEAIEHFSTDFKAACQLQGGLQILVCAYAFMADCTCSRDSVTLCYNETGAKLFMLLSSPYPFRKGMPSKTALTDSSINKPYCSSTTGD